MSHDLVTLVQQVSGKYRNKIDALVSPLASIFGVNAHAYYRIDSEGGVTYLTNLPEVSEYYFGNEIYIGNPILTDPHSIEPGFMLESTVENQEFQEAQRCIKQKFRLDNNLFIFEKQGDILHAHGFATTLPGVNLTNVYLNNLPRLQLYCSYFRQETDAFQDRLQEMKVDSSSLWSTHKKKELRRLKSAHRDTQGAFFQLMNKSKGKLKLVQPLSSRELECLALMLEGKPASAIAEQLLISARTVEHHIDHIRNKLMCSTKMEIFTFISTLKSCGGDLSMLQHPW